MTRRRKILKRVLLAVGGLVVGLLIAETVLWQLDIPRTYQARITPQNQFLIVPGLLDEGEGYLNAPSQVLRFTYDGNPRNYFGGKNEVDHTTNAAGYRGPPVVIEQDANGIVFIQKPPGTQRLVFLGDSFTFGEGVWLKDTYAEQTASLLRSEFGITDAKQLHALNLGVGGYNSEQERQLLIKVGLPAKPDVVVLGFVLNDAEPPLIQRDPLTGNTGRVLREIETFAKQSPPESWFYSLRSTKLLWHMKNRRQTTSKTIAFYRSLYDDSNPLWQKTRDALAGAAKTCRAAEIPFLVVVFPLLVELNDRYPLVDVHNKVARVVTENGGLVIDLLPRLKGRDARSLWVHPTDQHPNEIVHRIAAEAIKEKIVAEKLLPNPPQ